MIEFLTIIKNNNKNNVIMIIIIIIIMKTIILIIEIKIFYNKQYFKIQSIHFTYESKTPPYKS